MEKKPILWLLIGPSGSGKDTVASMIGGHDDWNVVCSFTSRPMRANEQNGREHYFNNENFCRSLIREAQQNRMARQHLNLPATYENIHSELLAYTEFGGHIYFTLCCEVLESRRNLYIIDERGANDLIKNFHDAFNIFVCEIVCDANIRVSRGVALERMARDTEREPLIVQPDYKIRNNFTLQHLNDEVNLFLFKCLEIESFGNHVSALF